MSEENKFRVEIFGYDYTSVEPKFHKSAKVSRTGMSRKAQSLLASAIGKDCRDINITIMEIKDQ